MPDDERQCDSCKTTCFLSAVSCQCKPSRKLFNDRNAFFQILFIEDILVCINHLDQLCSCLTRNYCIWYRYTMDEMADMLEALRERLDLCQKWKCLVNRLISNDHPNLIGKTKK